MSLMGRGGMGCRIHVLILSFLLPHSPNAEHKAGKSCIEVTDESKGITCINTWPGSAGLAKGHGCSRRTCFNAEPKLGAWRLHLTHAVQHNTCQGPLPPNQASWFGFLVWLPGLSLAPPQQ